MPSEKVGSFSIEYNLYTDAKAGNDVHFGMDFTLKNGDKALCQLIHPATVVGNNRAKEWNVDNHREGDDAGSLIYNDAHNGKIKDTPREISRPDKGVKRTKFTVYVVDVSKGIIYTSGVKFGYSINTSADKPKTEFIDFQQSNMSGEEKDLIRARCGNKVKFQ